ncbi:MAG TPA: hypothetical protein VHL58_03060 [Thermoanaerobaculia bacterium]|nr:hypothetical protein [Thermoanaerobaculia bacterium]
MANTNREKENLKSSKSQKSTTDSSFKKDVSSSSFSGPKNVGNEPRSMDHETSRNSGSGYESPGSKSKTGDTITDDRISRGRNRDTESGAPDLGRERSGPRNTMDRFGRNEH